MKIEELVNWSEPRKVSTKRGPKLLRKAPITFRDPFWDVWRAHKSDLKEAGVSVSKYDGDWQVCWWLPDEEAHEAIEQSRAVDTDVEIPMPDGLELYPFQKAGTAFAASREATLIGDEMGLGKTPQSLALANLDPSIERIIVVCPASLKLNWEREAKRFLLRDFTVVIARGRKAPATLSTDGPTILIINYDILSSWKETATAFAADLLIADEVHYAKNEKAQRSKALYSIPARRRVALTGTPIVNRPKELFPIIHWLDPATWPKFFSFAMKFCNAQQKSVGRYRTVWDFSGASNLDQLQNSLRSTIMVRRLKKDVLTELPPKIYQVIELPKNGTTKIVAAEQSKHEEIELAKKQLAAAQVSAKANEAGHQATLEQLRSKIQALFSELSTIRHEIAIAKTPSVIEHLETALDTEGTEGNPHKIICFAHHRDVIEAICDHFGNRAVRIYGGDSDVARQAAVDRFQSDPTCTLFVASIRAAGVGLTLTAAHHVAFAELDWTPSAMDQAADRAHRIGQDADHVLIQHIVLEDSLDAHIAKTLVRKSRVIVRALDAEHKHEELPRPELLEKDFAIPDKTAAISKIKELAAQIPEGYFAVESGGQNDLDFLRLDKPTEGKWAGRIFMARIIGGHRPQRVPFEQIATLLQKIIDAGPMVAMARYGQELGICGRCGRELTDETSREIGLGPTCRRKALG